MSDFIHKLQQKLQAPLPGRTAQLKMAPTSRRKYMAAPANARQAGVMATLFPKNKEWHVVLIERNPNDRDTHGGQISFPGGKAEPHDGTMLKTALRETEEEVGILQKEIKVLGKLSEVYIPVSNFNVYPFVGYLDFQPIYNIQEAEVYRVLEVPISHLKNEAAKQRTTDIPINKLLTLKNIPFYEVENKTLWGATAMMLSELLELTGDG
ncbi:MAG TPA: CoA pyrophosphatase [Bacteroidetes bacterium]|nr:CoA pyrophosphatase [Bacteroidota bacterium]